LVIQALPVLLNVPGVCLLLTCQQLVGFPGSLTSFLPFPAINNEEEAHVLETISLDDEPADRLVIDEEPQAAILVTNNSDIEIQPQLTVEDQPTILIIPVIEVKPQLASTSNQNHEPDGFGSSENPIELEDSDDDIRVEFPQSLPPTTDEEEDPLKKYESFDRASRSCMNCWNNNFINQRNICR
jgi:hypothetical protein